MSGERHKVWHPHFHALSGDAPFGLGEVDFWPPCPTQLTGADEHQRGEAQGALRHEEPLVRVDRPKQGTDALRFDN